MVKRRPNIWAVAQAGIGQPNLPVALFGGAASVSEERPFLWEELMKTGLFAATSVIVTLLFSAAMASDTQSGQADADNETVFDIEAGQALYKKNCRGCHGPTAK